ncbi:hypothetical protein EGW08_022959 [Elysia chlorotica]|uniref:M-phase-specific PLK1-interacting protein n=1 Tax=Elysia chlorotica TaxID=188477 RepID=A0A3S0ZK53_ELYCH|nr:hypothetical protein EGW08_022959 [Elysia chlorotica]
MPSWGAPAKGGNVSSPNLPQSPQNYSASDIKADHPNKVQRHSPYPNISQSRHGDISSGGQSLNSEQTQNAAMHNFSSDNPFASQTRFSAHNPFQNTQDSPRGSENPFQRDLPSPIHQRIPRPGFHPSPLMHTPGLRDHQPRFSPRTPSSNFHTPPSRFQSQSPQYQTPPNRFQSGSNRGFHSARRGFGNRNGSFSNPGGSDDIKKYVNPSMLDDPWKNLPATPLMQTY